jgi:hypothetical protein
MIAGFAGPESVIISWPVLALAAPNQRADAPQSPRFQVRACGFTTDSGRLLDAP